MRRVLNLFFFASGFAALIYQVAWVRILTVDFGTTVYAISTVLTVFMAGLALGSFLFGRWIDRGYHPLRAYGAIEAGLGVYAIAFALGTPYLHQASTWLLRGSSLDHGNSSILKFGIALVVLLPPTTLMGGTLPVLAKFITESKHTAGLRLGTLYGFNTLGAVLGALGEAHVFILMLGVQGSMLLAAAINLGLGIGSILLARRVAAPGPSETAPGGHSEPTDTREPLDSSRSVVLLHAVAFFSGLITLASEVLWTRLFVNFLSGNVLIFATILAAFLTGIAVGAFLVARWADRFRRLDVALGVVLAVSALCLVASVLGQTWLGALFDFVRKLDVRAGVSRTTAVYLSLATLFLVVSIPATVFGAVFPLLFRWCTRSLASLGSDIGRLYAANTLGSILGSFVAGFILIGELGVNASLVLLAACYASLSALVSRSRAVRIAGTVVSVACVAMLLAPSIRRPIYWFNAGFNVVQQIPPSATLFLREGVEGTVGVMENDATRRLTVNGIIVAEASKQDLWDLLLKAHLPMLIHEDPRRVALVGLGAGVSLGAVLAYDVDLVDCIEIDPGVVPAHKYFGAVNGRCWEDPRLRLTIDDGRHYLLMTDDRYDVISVDPTDPPVCYQYSQDFIQVCADRLADDGIMVQWVPLFHLSAWHLRIIMRAFTNVFPETSVWYDGTSVLLMGVKGTPLSVNVERFDDRLARPSVQRNLAVIGNPDANLLLATYAFGAHELERLIGPGIPENSDNRPYLDYKVLLAGRTGSRKMAANLELLADHYETIAQVLSPDSVPERRGKVLQRKHELMQDLLRLRIHVMRNEAALARQGALRLFSEYPMAPKEKRLLDPFVAPATLGN